ELKVKEGDVVPIETTLLVLEASGGAAVSATSAPAKEAPKPSVPAAAAVASKSNGHGPIAAASASVSSGGGGLDVYPPAADMRVLATPATRRLAREMTIDINGLHGTGLAGRVTRDDVLKSK